jgi:hypothetical protein
MPQPSSLFTFQKSGFNNQFRSHFGDGFQNWFSLLMQRLHRNGDVQSIRLTQGDGKLDVCVLSEQLVYQCYAPSEFRVSTAVAKIREDFWGAFNHLDGNLKKWIFVHNHPTGQLDKDCYKALSDTSAECSRIAGAVGVRLGNGTVVVSVGKWLAVKRSPGSVWISIASHDRFCDSRRAIAYLGANPLRRRFGKIDCAG